MNDQELSEQIVKTMLVKASQCQSKFNKLLRSYNMSLGRLEVLRVLRAHPQGRTMSEICTELTMLDSDVTRAVLKLTQAGFVHRERLEKRSGPNDRRNVIATITSEGQAKLDLVAQPFSDMMNSSLKKLSSKDRLDLKRLLDLYC